MNFIFRGTFFLASCVWPDELWDWDGVLSALGYRTTLQLSLEIPRANAREHGGETYEFKVGRSAVGTRARRGNLGFCELFLDRDTSTVTNKCALRSRERDQLEHAPIIVL